MIYAQCKVYFYNAVEAGKIALWFQEINGDTGKSKTILTGLDDGITITYQDLLNFNGYINVRQNVTEISTSIA